MAGEKKFAARGVHRPRRHLSNAGPPRACGSATRVYKRMSARAEAWEPNLADRFVRPAPLARRRCRAHVCRQRPGCNDVAFGDDGTLAGLSQRRIADRTTASAVFRRNSSAAIVAEPASSMHWFPRGVGAWTANGHGRVMRRRSDVRSLLFDLRAGNPVDGTGGAVNSRRWSIRFVLPAFWSRGRAALCRTRGPRSWRCRRCDFERRRTVVADGESFSDDGPT